MSTRLVVIAFWLTISVPAASSSGLAVCVAYESLDTEFKAADFVFEGRVVAVEWIPGRECCHVLSGWATIRSDRWWKGEPVKEIRIGAVGHIFSTGEEYVVFGFGDPPVADGCNSTQLKQKAGTTLQWLAKRPSRRARWWQFWR